MNPHEPDEYPRVPSGGRSRPPASGSTTTRIRCATGSISALGVFAVLALLAACGRSTSDADSAPTPARRIVALTVGSVDTLALLGQLERVVAVEEDCHVPGTEHLVRIRNDDHSGPSKALNVEAILALEPDLVIAKEDLEPALGGRGLRVEWIPSSFGVADVIPFVERLGARLGVPERSRELIDTMRAKTAAIERLVAGEPRVRVYYEYGKPGRTIGRGTVVDDMIRLAGGENIAGESALANPMLSVEAILVANPDVIVLSPWSDTPEEVARRPGWNRIAAVREGRLHQVPEKDRQLQYPSPSCLVGCESMLVPWFHPRLRGAGAK